MTVFIDRIKQLIGQYSDNLPSGAGVPVNAAVIVPLHEQDNRLWITFIKRSESTGLHRGQMGFPGGMAESSDDGDLLRTALRELKEEIGVKAEDVDVIGRLCTHSTVRSGLLVQPFAGIIPWPYLFTADLFEVQSVHTADLKIMASGVQGEGNHFGLIPPVYTVDEKPVWGLTARIVRELVKVLEPVLED